MHLVLSFQDLAARGQRQSCQSQSSWKYHDLNSPCLCAIKVPYCTCFNRAIFLDVGVMPTWDLDHLDHLDRVDLDHDSIGLWQQSCKSFYQVPWKDIHHPRSLQKRKRNVRLFSNAWDFFGFDVFWPFRCIGKGRRVSMPGFDQTLILFQHVSTLRSLRWLKEEKEESWLHACRVPLCFRLR